MKSVAKAIDVFKEGVTWCRLFIEVLCSEAGQSRMAVRCCCVKRHSLFFSWNIESYRIALQKVHCSRGKRRSTLYRAWCLDTQFYIKCGCLGSGCGA